LTLRNTKYRDCVNFWCLKVFKEAIRTFVYAIQKNRKLINEREIQGDVGTSKNGAGASYIDPNLFQEVKIFSKKS